jgi:hypothetical protein
MEAARGAHEQERAGELSPSVVVDTRAAAVIERGKAGLLLRPLSEAI